MNFDFFGFGFAVRLRFRYGEEDGLRGRFGLLGFFVFWRLLGLLGEGDDDRETSRAL